jgi:hypothetical protein
VKRGRRGAANVPGRPSAHTGESASARNAGIFGRLVQRVHPAEAEKMTALSSMEYPHWLMIAGVLLLISGFAGLALRQRGVEDEPYAAASDQEPPEPKANIDPVDVYNRTAKEKRRDRWAERFADEESVDAKSKIGEAK